MAKCIESTISGRNLDYDYLLWIKDIAFRLRVKGITFFKNDGSIKVVAEGEENNLNIFINKLKRGRYLPFFSPIENFSVKIKEPTDEFNDFSISEMRE